MPRTAAILRQRLGLVVLTAGAILIHGYHPYAEDAEIYVPGIKKILDPGLYPHDAAFFTSHAHLTFFPNWIAASIRITHLPLSPTLLVWHFLSIFLLLLACWRLAQLCFVEEGACWAGVAVVAALLTIPVAGTALYIMDQYLSPRSLSTPAIVFLIVNVVEKRLLRACLWIAFAVAVHPLMAVFGLFFVFLLAWMEAQPSQVSVEPQVALLVVPLGFFPPVTDAYRKVLDLHPYFFLLRWRWYEWLGIFGPVVLLWWFQRIAAIYRLQLLGLTCRALIVFTSFFLVVGLAITIPPPLANYAELQPMRSLHPVYILLFLFAGGLLGEFALKLHFWRWVALLLPLCAGMFYAQRELFPATPHVELPGMTVRNDWVQAFLWIRDHTPRDAYFALPPDYVEIPLEDQHGFRAISERSMLADRLKDAGAVSMFPGLAGVWERQVEAQNGWSAFRPLDFDNLHHEFGIDWVVLRQPGVHGLDCPYQNPTVQVCRVNASGK